MCITCIILNTYTHSKSKHRNLGKKYIHIYKSIKHVY
ncbi:unnamed protein product [Spodoptera exigua]|nr:unnamed protein product [Spodoptera exigua]